MESFTITPRKAYMDKIFRLLDNPKLMIVVGVRRSGKSCIAAQLEEELRGRLAADEDVVRINFETIDAVRITADDLIARFHREYVEGRRCYVLLDEVTHVVEWERAINYFCQYAACKLILFSSNRRILSRELTAVQEDRYDVVEVLPLSLGEFIRFQGFRELTPEGTPLRERRYGRFDDKTYTIEDIYRFYITYGGLPVLKPEYTDRERARVVTDGSYSAVVTRDILEVGGGNGESAITDPLLLRTIITIMAKSIGDNISATGIGKQTAAYLQRPSSTKTIESYIRALLNAHLFYIAERFDIRAGVGLKTLAKYYIVDSGLHNYVTGVRAEDESRLLENKVFFELLRRGYRVCNGKLGREEISLIARNSRGRIYIQVAGELNDETLKALASPLRKIRDSHPKLIIALDSESRTLEDGIVILNALEFFMGYPLGRR